jgi:Fis family transcriptional regulator
VANNSSTIRREYPDFYKRLRIIAFGDIAGSGQHHNGNRGWSLLGGRGVVAKSVRSKSSTRKHTAPRHGASTVRIRNRPLRDYTEEALQKYFGDLNGHRPGDLYELVLGEVEEPLFKTVLDYTKGNQSVAAEILGINRATLRKKLRHYQLLG